ncbi:membrane protein [Luteipulveratus mongoliensis]|uniref:Membrane protein n=1 Tax=Luteipulveratus mongoliensis TaxID=571913 RepID=A0A0K1JP73_9MICO|nr:membrane protein [Luteipulveratus mongoliensis]
MLEQPATESTSATAATLRRLYLARFGFAVVWAALLALTGSDLGLVAGVLLVLYPLVDVASAVIDARASRARELRLNIVISAVAALGLALAAASGVPAVLRVWGAWAVLAGVVQLVLGLRRRRLGGQWAMIFSGGISTVAGASFIAMASQDDPALTSLAGYAVLGGIFFLISALRVKP